MPAHIKCIHCYLSKNAVKLLFLQRFKSKAVLLQLEPAWYFRAENGLNLTPTWQGCALPTELFPQNSSAFQRNGTKYILF